MNEQDDNFFFMGSENTPFGSDEQKEKLEDFLKRKLVKRVTIIEGHMPTEKEQKSFIERIKDFLRKTKQWPPNG